MRSYPTPSFTTKPHSMTYLIHPPVSSFRVRCCCACSFMLIQTHPTPPSQIEGGSERERKWERHKCLKGLKKHYSFSNRFRHSKYSNICTSPPLSSASLLPCLALWGRLAEGKLSDSGRKIKGGRVRDLGGARERGLYRQGQVRVQGSWWHQLRLGRGAPVILWAHICFLSSWTPPLSLPSASPI